MDTPNTPSSPAEPVTGETPDWWNLIAHQRGLPANWRWFGVEFKGETRADGVFIVRGAICNAKFTRGKRKGQTNWSKRTDEREIVITPAQMTEAQQRWQAETGLCFECGGSGELLKSIGTNGKTYRPCPRCKAVRP